MNTVIPLLSNLKVAAPCSASWQDMEAVDGDRVHFCSGCKKNVYNLSAMTQTQAEGLLRKHEGHLCVRYYKRTDGTILTQNCPVGQAALRMKMIARSKQAALATAALASISTLGMALGAMYANDHVMGERVRLAPRPQQAVPAIERSRAMMGEVYVSPEVDGATETQAIVGDASIEAVAQEQQSPVNMPAHSQSLIEGTDPELHTPPVAATER